MKITSWGQFLLRQGPISCRKESGGGNPLRLLLVLRLNHILHIIVMAGLVPAIPVFPSHRSTCRGSVGARSKSGHDEFTGVLDHLNESEHWPVLARMGNPKR